MTSLTTITKNGIRNYNLHGSYKYTSYFANSLKGQSSYQRNNRFYEPINTNLWQNECTFRSLQTSQKFGFSYFGIKKLTLPSEGLWPVNTGLLWSFVSFSGPQVHQNLYHPTYWFFENYQLAPSVGSWRLFNDLSYDKKFSWFGLDQGLPAQAIKKVGML